MHQYILTLEACADSIILVLQSARAHCEIRFALSQTISLTHCVMIYFKYDILSRPIATLPKLD